MTYNPNIPLPDPSPANQVTAVQTNFSQLAAIFSATVAGIKYNHTAFNDFNQGDHEAILLQSQSNDPGVTQNLDVVYCKNIASASSTQPQIFVQIPAFLPGVANESMQLTFNTVNNSGTTYQSFLAGGYLIFFGKSTVKNINITLSPTPSTILTAISNSNTMTSVGSPIPFDAEISIAQPNTIDLRSNLATGVFSFTWIVIAKA